MDKIPKPARPTQPTERAGARGPWRQRLLVAGLLAALAQAVAVAQAPVPAAPQAVRDCDVCPELLPVPAGRFTMGTPNVRAERPARQVEVGAFLMGRFEVTQAQWRAVMGANPSEFDSCGPDCPVDSVSWDDAQAYLRRLSERTGKAYRLPSEAEWEYAARAGTSTAYIHGDERENLDRHGWSSHNSGGRTHPVGRLLPNAFGLHDMSGNVLEWVQDAWYSSYEGAPPDATPRAADSASGSDPARTVRGGSWQSYDVGLRVAARAGYTPSQGSPAVGLRVVRAP